MAFSFFFFLPRGYSFLWKEREDLDGVSFGIREESRNACVAMLLPALELLFLRFDRVAQKDEFMDESTNIQRRL